MANKSKNTGNDKNPNEQQDKRQNQQSDKKKGFDQGMGNNNASDSEKKTNQPERSGANLRSEDRKDMGNPDKATNVDRKVTNQADQGIDPRQHTPVDDDADTISQKNEPEINPPHTQPEKTEKKLPEM